MIFKYFSWEEYFLVIAGFLFLILSIIFFRSERKPVFSLVLLVLGAICLRWFAISIDPFLNIWDEQFHALVSRNLVSHPLTPTLYDQPFYETNFKHWRENSIWLHKQPLFLWQMALSLKVFGFNEIALRLPDFLMTVLISLLIFRMGKLTMSAKAGLYAAIIFTTNNYSLQLMNGFGPTDHNDIAFLFYVTASFWAWLEWTYSKNKKWIYAIGIFAGGAVLIKWLTGLLIFSVWGFTILIIGKKEDGFRRFTPLLKSLLIALIVFLPWQIYCFIKFPVEFKWERYVDSLHFFKALEGHVGDMWFHFDSLKFLYNSWAPILIIPGFLLMIKDSNNRKVAFGLIAAILIIYIFFTIAKTKLFAFTFPVAGIICPALGALFLNLEKLFHRISKKMYPVFLFIISLFIYFNFNLQNIEQTHGIDRFHPKDNYYVVDRIHDAKLSKMIAGKIDLKQNPVIFNVPLFSCTMVMFYTGTTCYDTIPSELDVSKLKVMGRKIYLLDRENLSDSLRNNKSFELISYPEFTPVKIQNVAFKFSNGKYFCYRQADDFSQSVLSLQPGPWETFVMTQYADSSCSFHAWNQTYLSVNLSGDETVSFISTKAMEWEHFKIDYLSNGKLAIRDCNNKYVSLTNENTLRSVSHEFTKEAEVEIIIVK